MAIEVLDFGKTWTEQRESVPIDVNKSKFTLSELAAEWHFFTHGIFFYPPGPFTFPLEDPVADWLGQQSHGVQVIQQPFDKPVFAGLDAKTSCGLPWNNVVCAVRHEYWQSLWEFVGGVCAINPSANTFYRAFSGDIDIYDPVALTNASLLLTQPPAIRVTVFCLESNKDRWEIRPQDSIMGLPTFVRVPPSAEVSMIARAAMKGDASLLTNHKNSAFQVFLDEYKKVLATGPQVKV